MFQQARLTTPWLAPPQGFDGGTLSVAHDDGELAGRFDLRPCSCSWPGSPELGGLTAESQASGEGATRVGGDAQRNRAADSRSRPAWCRDAHFWRVAGVVGRARAVGLRMPRRGRRSLTRAAPPRQRREPYHRRRRPDSAALNPPPGATKGGRRSTIETRRRSIAPDVASSRRGRCRDDAARFASPGSSMRQLPSAPSIPLLVTQRMLAGSVADAAAPRMPTGPSARPSRSPGCRAKCRKSGGVPMCVQRSHRGFRKHPANDCVAALKSKSNGPYNVFITARRRFGG